MPRTWMASMLAGLAVCGLCGCNSSEPTAYRTYSEQQDAETVATSDESSEPTESVPTASNESTESVAVAGSSSSSNAVGQPGDAPSVANVNETDESPSTTLVQTAENSSATRPPRVPLPDPIALASAISVADPGTTSSSSSPTPGDASATTAGAAPGDAAAGAGEPAEPRQIQLLVPEKQFAAVAPDRSLRVSYDDLDLLKVLNMDPVVANCTDYFPSWMKDLDGKRIRLRGFMYPPTKSKGLKGFVLARDNQACCFGPNPKVYFLIPVFMKEGTVTDYIPLTRPFDVTGVFHIRPDVYKGNVDNLFEIDDAAVIDQ